MKSYSQRSQDNLDSADPRLILIFTEALQIIDHSILCGYRDGKEQLALYIEKKTKIRSGGKHNSKPSLAVDALPYPINYEDTERMCLFAGIILAIAHKYGVKIRWGRDWDGDTNLIEETFLDYAHFEIADE